MEENIKPVKSKKEKIKLAVLVVSILMIVGSMSYAFFVAATSTPAITDVDLTTETSEALIFTPGTPINLVANLTNFAENAGSLSESTTSTATLRAASSVGSATEDYYVYFNIKANDFVYTVDANTPELLLTITDPNGDEVTEITGLTHKTVGSVSGFDVTTHEGLIAVKELYQITTTNETIDSWTATITFINLNSDQTLNEGKTFDSELILRQDPMSEGIALAQYVTENHDTTQGLYHHTAALATSVSDNNYRYAGGPTEVNNNWVCFGSDITPCPEANLYRILGVYDGNVKLIKYISILGTPEFEAGSGDFVSTVLIPELNEDFYNTIPTEYQNFIKTSTWYLGDVNTTEFAEGGVWYKSPLEFYDEQIGNPVNNQTQNLKIGLMYMSDFGLSVVAYGNSPMMSLDGYNYETSSSWLYKYGTLDDGITKILDESDELVFTFESSTVWLFGKYPAYIPTIYDYNYPYYLRPTFYLETGVKYVSGTGTQSDPFIIGM